MRSCRCNLSASCWIYPPTAPRQTSHAGNSSACNRDLLLILFVAGLGSEMHIVAM